MISLRKYLATGDFGSFLWMALRCSLMRNRSSLRVMQVYCKPHGQEHRYTTLLDPQLRNILVYSLFVTKDFKRLHFRIPAQLRQGKKSSASSRRSMRQVSARTSMSQAAGRGVSEQGNIMKRIWAHSLQYMPVLSNNIFNVRSVMSVWYSTPQKNIFYCCCVCLVMCHVCP